MRHRFCQLADTPANATGAAPDHGELNVVRSDSRTTAVPKKKKKHLDVKAKFDPAVIFFGTNNLRGGAPAAGEEAHAVHHEKLRGAQNGATHTLHKEKNAQMNDDHKHQDVVPPSLSEDHKASSVRQTLPVLVQ